MTPPLDGTGVLRLLHENVAAAEKAFNSIDPDPTKVLNAGFVAICAVMRLSGHPSVEQAKRERTAGLQRLSGQPLKAATATAGEIAQQRILYRQPFAGVVWVLFTEMLRAQDFRNQAIAQGEQVVAATAARAVYAISLKIDNYIAAYANAGADILHAAGLDAARIIDPAFPRPSGLVERLRRRLRTLFKRGRRDPAAS